MTCGEQLFLEGVPAHCGCLTHNGFLTRSGYRALDWAEQRRQVDKVRSVSALVEVEVDDHYDPTHNELNRRFPRVSSR